VGPFVRSVEPSRVDDTGWPLVKLVPVTSYFRIAVDVVLPIAVAVYAIYALMAMPIRKPEYRDGSVKLNSGIVGSVLPDHGRMRSPVA
jgi:hypothetical protein